MNGIDLYALRDMSLPATLSLSASPGPIHRTDLTPSCGVFPQLQGASFFLFNTGSKPEVVMGSKVSTKMAAPTARIVQVTLALNLELL